MVHKLLANLRDLNNAIADGTALVLSKLSPTFKNLTAANGYIGGSAGAIPLVGTYVVAETIKATTYTGAILSIPVPVLSIDVDKFVWVAPIACTLISVTELHSVISTGAATLGIRKITADSQAPGAAAGASVIELLASAIDLNGVAANTKQTASLSAVAGALSIAAGNRIAFDFSAALTGLAGCVATLNFQI